MVLPPLTSYNCGGCFLIISCLYQLSLGHSASRFFYSHFMLVDVCLNIKSDISYSKRTLYFYKPLPLDSLCSDFFRDVILDNNETVIQFDSWISSEIRKVKVEPSYIENNSVADWMLVYNLWSRVLLDYGAFSVSLWDCPIALLIH